MSIAALQLGEDVQVENEDVLPSGGGFTLDTGLYAMVVDNAFLQKSSGGALGLKLHLKLKGGDKRIFRFEIWTTSGDKKGNKPYYEKDGKKHPLPGYTMADHIARICADLPISQVEPEKKLVKLWDYEAKAEVPTEVPVLTQLVGQEISVGIQKRRQNKRVQQGDQWVDGPKAREFNEIAKVFYPDGFTVTEKAAEAEEATFVNKWVDANPSDYVRDDFKAVAGAPASGGSAPAAAAAPDDLFDD